MDAVDFHAQFAPADGRVQQYAWHAVAEALFLNCAPTVPFAKHGVPDEYIPVGPPAALYAKYRLDAPGLAAAARELLR